jgi:WD40 repeat protein
MERNGRLLLLDLQSPDRAGRVVFESPEQRWIYTWKYDQSGEQLIVGTLRSWAWLVRLEDGQQICLPDAPKESAAVAFSPSGNRVAVGGGPQSSQEDTFARVLDREGHLLARLDAGSGENIHDLEFLTDAELIVATPKALRWWNTESNEVRLLRNEGHGKVIVSEHYVLSDTTEEVWLYDRATLTGRVLVDMEARAVTALAIAPDESFVVAGNYDGSFRVRHLDEDRPHYLPGVQDVIWGLWIDPQGHWIAAIAGKDLVTYWPVPHGRPLHDRPLEEFLEVLRAQTNLRVVTDPDDPKGYRETATKFPGWETVPTWQEWYSEEYMKDPPWKPMLDLEALETAKRSLELD